MNKQQYDTHPETKKTGQTEDFVFYYKKTEKIVSALYLVTGHFDREEPLKWRIRQKANELHEAVNRLKDTNGHYLRECKQNLINIIEEISSLIDMSRLSGLVSESNADVCLVELRRLWSGIVSVNTFATRDNVGLRDMFADESKGDQSQSREGVVRKEMQSVDRSDYSVSSGSQQSVGTSQFSKLKSVSLGSDSNKQSIESVSAHSPKPAVQAKKNKRQKAILRLIRQKGEINVKDATTVVSNCSEKTLQRELQALVREGVLKKEGERRWTRYSFA